MHFFISNKDINFEKKEIYITKDTELFYHLTKSLRIKVGEKISFCLENKAIFISEVLKNKDCLLCLITEERKPNIDNFKVDVYHGTIKYAKWQEGIRNSICSGANSITPVNMDRSIAHIDNNKIERLQKIAYSSAEISQIPFVPKIHNPLSFSDFLEKISSYDLFIFPYEEEKTKTLKSIQDKVLNSNNIGIIAGPEGGISKEEIKKVQNYSNLEIITLGSRILLTQIAPAFLLSEIMYIKSK